MMTHQLEVSILAAPLASIDRRVLSQAWYSALGFVPNALPARGCRNNACGVSGRSFPHRDTVEPAKRLATQLFRTSIVPAKQPPRRGKDEHDVRRVRTRCAKGAALEQRIERVFSNASFSPRRATFSLGRGSARIHVILQTQGSRTTLLALCRPEMRALVAEALSHARIALAARNIGVEMRPVGGRECS
ncbi:MAG: hypothetical protein JOZ77_09785 [Candidatus Eremiobacteraeota bacterium]|nr:hypothetical protein [Candidatus Eremiobacteraeota bacterium]